MKSTVRFLSLVLITIILQQCNEEQDQGPPGQIRFSFNSIRNQDNGGRTTEDIPAGSYLVVSIQTSPGNYVYNNEHVDLLKVGDTFISPPLSLKPGNYFVTDFFVVSPEHEVIYATPQAGSALAANVDHPLPVDFSITSDGLLNLTMEVVSAANSSPEDFGYVSFEIDTVTVAHFQISVFIPGESTPEFTSAELVIFHNGDTVKTQLLEATINTVYFDEDPADKFSLVVIKQGYARYTRIFSLYELEDELNGKPLLVMLTPALTFTAVVETDGYLSQSFHFDITGPNGNATIDWGDGQTENFPLYDHSEDHLYDKAGKYFVTITGDLQNITDFYSYYGDGPMEEVDLMHLTELKDVRIGFTPGPRIIDLRQNKKLEYVDVSVNTNLEELLIAPDNVIKWLGISGPNHVSAAAINAVIDNLYQSVIDSDVDRTGGTFSYQIIGSGHENETVGPPSGTSLEKLNDLRTNYGWQILP